MPVIEGKKYACAACIKGHRTSACQHTDRPIFEIKKKGRPPSQCQKCRDLRKYKDSHVKCSCNDKSASAEVETPEAGPSGSSTPSEKAPTVPNAKALLAIKRATIQRAYMCGCQSGGKCICPDKDELTSPPDMMAQPIPTSSCCSKKAEIFAVPELPHKTPTYPPFGDFSAYSLPSTPSLGSSSGMIQSSSSSGFSDSQYSSTFPMVYPEYQQHDNTFLQSITAPYSPVDYSPSGLPFPNLDLSTVDTISQPSPVPFSDWLFGDILIPPHLLSKSPQPTLPSDQFTATLPAEASCTGCGPSCKCGDNCGCAHLQALHDSLGLPDDRDPNIDPYDRGFVESLLGPMPVGTTVSSWQQSVYQEVESEQEPKRKKARLSEDIPVDPALFALPDSTASGFSEFQPAPIKKSCCSKKS